MQVDKSPKNGAAKATSRSRSRSRGRHEDDSSKESKTMLARKAPRSVAFAGERNLSAAQIQALSIAMAFDTIEGLISAATSSATAAHIRNAIRMADMRIKYGAPQEVADALKVAS